VTQITIARSVVGLAFIVLLVAALAAQTPSRDDDTNRRAEQYVSGLGRGAAPSGGALDPLAPPLVPLVPQSVEKVPMTPETQTEYQAALREYFTYTRWAVSHRKEVFAWQLFSSRIIFWAVLSLVAAGMYFAAVQFQRGLRRRRPAAGGEEVTEIAASLTGVKVRSPILGVLILVISFAFFYLYLQFVYPITTTF
jgi:hypothetical protein